MTTLVTPTVRASGTNICIPFYSPFDTYRSFNIARYNKHLSDLSNGTFTLSKNEIKFPALELLVAAADSPSAEFGLKKLLTQGTSGQKSKAMKLLLTFQNRIQIQQGIKYKDVVSLIEGAYSISHPFYSRWLEAITPQGQLENIATIKLRKALLSRSLISNLNKLGFPSVDRKANVVLESLTHYTPEAIKTSLFLAGVYFVGVVSPYPRPSVTALRMNVPEHIIQQGSREGFEVALNSLKTSLLKHSHADWTAKWASIFYLVYFSVITGPQIAPYIPIIAQGIQMKFLTEHDLRAIQEKKYSPDVVREIALRAFAENIRDTENREPTAQELAEKKQYLSILPDSVFQMEK